MQNFISGFVYKIPNYPHHGVCGSADKNKSLVSTAVSISFKIRTIILTALLIKSLSILAISIISFNQCQPHLFIFFFSLGAYVMLIQGSIYLIVFYEVRL